jgi:hypothetical protein
MSKIPNRAEVPVPTQSETSASHGRWFWVRRLQKSLALVGIMMAAPFFVWFVIGMLPNVPSMVHIFGIEGLRIPASITISGLLLSAIGFYET